MSIFSFHSFPFTSWFISCLSGWFSSLCYLLPHPPDSHHCATKSFNSSSAELCDREGELGARQEHRGDFCLLWRSLTRIFYFACLFLGSSALFQPLRRSWLALHTHRSQQPQARHIEKVILAFLWCLNFFAEQEMSYSRIRRVQDTNAMEKLSPPPPSVTNPSFPVMESGDGKNDTL